jgi:hypothetical protein
MVHEEKGIFEDQYKNGLTKRNCKGDEAKHWV